MCIQYKHTHTDSLDMCIRGMAYVPYVPVVKEQLFTSWDGALCKYSNPVIAVYHHH